MIMKNAIVWFEIPTQDFNRAVKFYRNTVAWEIIIDESMWMKMALFPSDQKEWVWWALVDMPDIKPTKEWISVYFPVDDVEKMAAIVENNWWKVIMPKMDIWKDMWFIVQFIDTEWNRIWLHSMK